MAGSDDAPQKTNGDVWTRLNQQGDSINELAKAQAATEAHLAALATAVETGFAAINSNINRIVDKENRPTNWIGLGSLIIVVIGALLTFVTLQTDPVRLSAVKNDQRIEAAFTRELELARELGGIQTRLEYLHEQQRLIDEWGSRRWIKDGNK